MNFAWLFLSCLFYLAAVEYREVNGFTFDDLDFVRSAIEDVSKSITSKPATKISKTPLRVASYGYHKYSTADSISHYRDKVVLHGGVLTKPETLSKKPRNLNKFNEAMDQVERAMAQAELSRKKVKLSDLKNEIIDAVKRGNVR